MGTNIFPIRRTVAETFSMSYIETRFLQSAAREGRAGLPAAAPTSILPRRSVAHHSSPDRMFLDSGEIELPLTEFHT